MFTEEELNELIVVWIGEDAEAREIRYVDMKSVYLEWNIVFNRKETLSQWIRFLYLILEDNIINL